MGDPSSPVLSNIYMEFFEQVAMDSTTYKPSLWLWYADHTFVIWKHDTVELLHFPHHLNNMTNIH